MKLKKSLAQSQNYRSIHFTFRLQKKIIVRREQKTYDYYENGHKICTVNTKKVKICVFNNNCLRDDM